MTRPTLQLFVGYECPTPDQLTPIKPKHDGGWVKPNGGLWTSTYLGPERGSDWVRWDRAEGMGWTNRHWWVLRPALTARVLTIDSLSDLQRAHERYPIIQEHGRFRSRYLDFGAISHDYDAVRLTERGQRRTRYSVDAYDQLDLYGWDCESTVWFRWVFVGQAEAVTPTTGEQEMAS